MSAIGAMTSGTSTAMTHQISQQPTRVGRDNDGDNDATESKSAKAAEASSASGRQIDIKA